MFRIFLMQKDKILKANNIKKRKQFKKLFIHNIFEKIF